MSKATILLEINYQLREGQEKTIPDWSFLRNCLIGENNFLKGVITEVTILSDTIVRVTDGLDDLLDEIEKYDKMCNPNS